MMLPGFFVQFLQQPLVVDSNGTMLNDFLSQFVSQFLVFFLQFQQFSGESSD
jgi:hypothetical protein